MPKISIGWVVRSLLMVAVGLFIINSIPQLKQLTRNS